MTVFKCAGLKRALIATAALVAVGPAFADKAKPVIGFTVYDMTSFIAWGKQGAEAVTKANNGVLLWQTGHGDVNAQNAQIRQFINQKVDVIVVAAADTTKMGEALDEAAKAGIPVVATNLSFVSPDADKLVSYVGPNDVGAGEQEANAVVQALKGKGNVVVMQGPLVSSGAIDRTKGIEAILAKNPGIKLLAMKPANWDRTQAYKLMQEWMATYGTQIDGLIAENDDMAIGAIQALREKGLNGKIPVAGVDAIKDGLRAVRSGDMIQTNLQNGALELGMAVQVAVDTVQGKVVPKSAMLQMPGIMKAEVDKFYDQLFDHSSTFVASLPDLVKSNLVSGQYASE